MNTYLIFFGKSQDFTFHAFDSSRYINDFNSIIKDFDELESKVFTIDDISNKEILSKYNFIKNDRKYSLLKLYSLGQASNGSRISGSIYGVGLLSETELEISETNNAILYSVKKSFASLCLDGAKFKSSDFYNEAETIWNALVNHKDGNYFNKINYRNGNFCINNKLKAFFMPEIIKDSSEISNEINNVSRLYISNDLEHLTRTQNKWGKETFPIFIKENNQYVLYAEKPKKTTNLVQGNQDPEISELKFKNAELRNELSAYEHKYRKFKESANKKFKIASIFAVVFCLTALAFVFKSVLLDDKKDNSYDEQPPKQIAGNDNGYTNTTKQQLNQVNLNDFLADANNRSILFTLLQNIKNFEASIDKKKYSDAILKDAEKLGLNSAFNEKYIINDRKNEANTNRIEASELQKPKVAEPQKPKVAEPQKPKIAEPQIPKVAEPQKPKIADPQKPKVAEPQKPKVAEPQKPKVAEPQKSKEAEPQKPKVAEPQKSKEAESQKNKEAEQKKE